MGKVVGIDLGTTNSCIAILERGKPMVFSAGDPGPVAQILERSGGKLTTVIAIPVRTTLHKLGLLVFYAWCLQCAATLAIIRRETNSWRWPVFAWSYMTVLGYSGAFLIYQFGSM